MEARTNANRENDQKKNFSFHHRQKNSAAVNYHLIAGILKLQGKPITMRDLEELYIITILEAHRGNQTAAARAAGIARRTLIRRMQKHASHAPSILL